MMHALPHDRIYDEAPLYDLAFSYRDIPAEVDFIEAAYAEATGSARPRRMVELASGPGRHAQEFARRGVSAHAVDLAPAMVAFGQQSAQTAGVHVQYHCGDMRDIRLQPPADLVVCMLCSAGYLVEEDDLARHLRTVRDLLRPGGLYLAELAHPGDIPADADGGRTQNEWTMDGPDGVLDVSWAEAPDAESPGERTVIAQARLTWTPRDGAPRVVEANSAQRVYEEREWRHQVAACDGLSFVNSWGAFDPHVGVNAPEAWRMIVAVRRS